MSEKLTKADRELLATAARPDLQALLERVERASGEALDAVRERFEDKFIPEPNSGCWLWLAACIDPRGRRPRGVFGLYGRNLLASRASMLIYRGAAIDSAMVCHHCDNSLCVNPDHLYLGDHASNMADMSLRRRSFGAQQPDRVRAIGQRLGSSNTWARGVDNPKNKLSPEQVAAIKNDTRATRHVAADFGVDRTTVQRIRRGALWRLQ